MTQSPSPLALDERGLLPCPFCGERDHLYPAYRLDKDRKCVEPPYAIDCLGCGTDLTPREGMDARAAWNRRLSAVPASQAVAWEVRGAELHRVFLDEDEARQLASGFSGSVKPLFAAPDALLREMDEARAILAGVDIGSLPNDWTLVQVAEARWDDIHKLRHQVRDTCRRAEAAEACAALSAVPASQAVAWDDLPCAQTDDAPPLNVLAGIRYCAKRWDGDARIIGNVRAIDIVRAIEAIRALASIPGEV